MPYCTKPVYNFEAGEVPCGSRSHPGSPGRCWKHADETAHLRSAAAARGAATRRRRRSPWSRILAFFGSRR